MRIYALLHGDKGVGRDHRVELLGRRVHSCVRERETEGCDE